MHRLPGTRTRFAASAIAAATLAAAWAGALPGAAPTSAAQPTPAPFCRPGQPPEFVLGFAALKQRLGAIMGDPLECEHAGDLPGTSVQQTSTGLAVYDARSGLLKFTNGAQNWAATQRGIVTWTGDGPPPRR